MQWTGLKDHSREPGTSCRPKILLDNNIVPTIPTCSVTSESQVIKPISAIASEWKSIRLWHALTKQRVSVYRPCPSSRSDDLLKRTNDHPRTRILNQRRARFPTVVSRDPYWTFRHNFLHALHILHILHILEYKNMRRLSNARKVCDQW